MTVKLKLVNRTVRHFFALIWIAPSLPKQILEWYQNKVWFVHIRNLYWLYKVDLGFVFRNMPRKITNKNVGNNQNEKKLPRLN